MEEAHEDVTDVFPAEYVFGLWEELNSAWIEQLRQKLRTLQIILGTDEPRKEDLKFVAFAPGPGGVTTLTFPKVYGDPAGYYQQVCVPRQNRALKRLMYGQLHKKPPKAGTTEEPEDERAGEDKGGSKSGDKPKAAYPAGNELSGKEASASVQNAPTCKATGKPICWDAACHIGCKRSAAECPHSHDAITSTKTLH
ncbi:unnamed protein product [Polarella glacialis]|uniref:C3H1-type domain-containing protein n=1 Tax=Polarella glacialis TaxID=89957 RepID=A0A813HST4_POLGL|nr:unnamed protein product [Polarella glacialis]